MWAKVQQGALVRRSKSSYVEESESRHVAQRGRQRPNQPIVVKRDAG